MKKFTKQQNQTLSDIYHRIHAFNALCNLDNPIRLIELPSIAKGLVKLDILTPICTETPSICNWYELTPKGKKFFIPYLNDKPSDLELYRLSQRSTYKEFNYPTD